MVPCLGFFTLTPLAGFGCPDASEFFVEKGVFGLFQTFIFSEEFFCFVAGEFQESDIGELSHTEIGQAALAGAEEFPRPPQFKVFLCQEETVLRLLHDLQAFPSFLCAGLGE